MVRFQKEVEGHLCKSCIHKHFWEMTTTTLFLGWWGIISFIVTPFFLLSNIGQYLLCLGMPSVPAEASAPRLPEREYEQIPGRAMFVVIVCTNCEGASQVDEATLGQVVQCPHCGKPTTARPKEAVLPVAKPLQQEPLSLDDAPALPSRSEPRRVAPRSLQAVKKRSPLKMALYSTLSLLVTLALMAGIYGGFRYGNAEVPNWAWKTFTPPDEQAQAIDMPGDPEAESISPEGFASTGGKRFHVHRWFEQVDVDFGWIDLNADQAADRPFRSHRRRTCCAPKDETIYGRGPKRKTPAGFIGPRGRKFEARRFMIDSDQGKAQMQVYFDPDPTRLTFHNKKETETRQIRLPMPTPWGSAGWVTIDYVEQFERRVFEPGQSIRLYFAIARGKKLDQKMPWVDKFFNSFAPD